MMRRQLLQTAAATAAAALARPSLAQGARVLRYVPQADLANPDPVWSTATVVFIHAYMIWDQLYSRGPSPNSRAWSSPAKVSLSNFLRVVGPAHRDDLTGFAKSSFPVFWGVKQVDFSLVTCR